MGWGRNTPDKSTKTAVKALEDGWFKHMPDPRAILRDCGPAFKSKEWSAAMASKGIADFSSYEYHPRGNAIVERANCGIKTSMRIEWEKEPMMRGDQVASLAADAHNALPNRTTEISPAHAMFGVEFADVDMRKFLTPEDTTPVEYQRRQSAIIDTLRYNLRSATDPQPYRPIKVGDWVIRARSNAERTNLQVATKLPLQQVARSHWPLKVEEVRDSGLVVLDLRTGVRTTIPRRSARALSISEETSPADTGMKFVDAEDVARYEGLHGTVSKGSTETRDDAEREMT